MINRQRICGLPPSGYDMGVTIPGSSPSGLLYSHQAIGGAVGNHNLLPISHSSLQRNTMSPQRPCSAGNAGLMASDLPNTVVSSVGNGSFSSHCSSPSLMSPAGVSKNMQDKSPPHMGMSHKPELRTLMPPSNKCSIMPTFLFSVSNRQTSLSFSQNQRINHSQTAQTLSTPAVSIAASGIGGYPSAISSYSTDFSLGSDLSSLSGFGGSGLGSVASWQQQQLQNLQHSALDVGVHHNLHIKCEPASPPRDRSLGMGGAGLRGGVNTAGYALGAARGASSCGSSYEGSEEREDHHGNESFLLQPLPSQEERHSPSVKRMRLSEGWAT
uniref:Uncharacterized protein n=1 Tax=Poecilia latipinna TaxID=48699 RepID=A0A3B3TLF9_9TELE